MVLSKSVEGFVSLTKEVNARREGNDCKRKVVRKERHQGAQKKKKEFTAGSWLEVRSGIGRRGNGGGIHVREIGDSIIGNFIPPINANITVTTICEFMSVCVRACLCVCIGLPTWFVGVTKAPQNFRPSAFRCGIKF